MSSIPVNLATEDELSEIVLRRLLALTNREYHVGTVYRRGGFGYLRRTINGWNTAARGSPFVVLTDSDDSPCPSALIRSWLTSPLHPNLIFRVAVREVEAWLLADTENFARFLAVAEVRVPAHPDEIPDPKATLMELAKRCRSSEINGRLLPRHGSTAEQGPDYNGCLGGFVAIEWDGDRLHASHQASRRR
jgi:hypothetical protein